MNRVIFQIVKVGRQWRWQAIGPRGIVRSYSSDEFRSPALAVEDICAHLSGLLGGPVFAVEPAIGKETVVTKSVSIWRRS